MKKRIAPVADLDLNTLSLEQLFDLHEKIEKIINHKAQLEREIAWATLHRLEKFDQRERIGSKAQLGIAGASPLKGRKILPQFRNPANPAEIWAGRGRKPAWVIAALEAGKTLDDLRIKKTDRRD